LGIIWPPQQPLWQFGGVAAFLPNSIECDWYAAGRLFGPKMPPAFGAGYIKLAFCWPTIGWPGAAPHRPTNTLSLFPARLVGYGHIMVHEYHLDEKIPFGGWVLQAEPVKSAEVSRYIHQPTATTSKQAAVGDGLDEKPQTTRAFSTMVRWRVLLLVVAP
jgi:hypothetical protein